MPTRTGRRVMEAQLEKFMAIYSEELAKAVTKTPDKYAFPIDDVPKVLVRIRVALQKGMYNKEGDAFKATCKRLEIPHSRQAISCFLAGEAVPADE